MRKSMFGWAVVAMLATSPACAADAVPSGADQRAQAAALSDCLIRKSTGEDRIAVAQWMLAAMASGPQMKDLFKVDPALKAELDKRMAATFTRLMVTACSDESRPLFKAHSKEGFRAAGNTLGGIAIRELLSDPAAVRELEAYVQYLNKSDFAGVAE
jgi:hypothetical protein